MANNGAGLIDDIPERDRRISDRLKFLWDNHLKLSNMVLSVSTGTLLVFLNSFRADDRSECVLVSAAVIGAALALVSLFSALTWRFVSQYFTEVEVFGNRADVENYFDRADVDAITKSHERSKRARDIYAFPYWTAQWVSFVSLVASSASSSRSSRPTSGSDVSGPHCGRPRGTAFPPIVRRVRARSPQDCTGRRRLLAAAERW